MDGQQIQLSPEQIQRAAKAGLTLLNTPGAVKVDGPMCISGEVQVLNTLLTAIINRQLIIANAPTPEKTPPGGKEEKKTDLKSVPDKKEASEK